MIFTETNLQGAFLVEWKRIEDHRGFFARAWCKDEFGDHGLETEFLQVNVGFSPAKGTLRGLHYQEPPHSECKFVRCTRGAIYDVIVDLRSASPTVGQWFGVELRADEGKMLYAPQGFAHGYQTLEPDTEMYYMTTSRYAAGASRGVR
jgi:dTDP-4-dehydrorhamnose 3,5-epimerase